VFVFKQFLLSTVLMHDFNVAKKKSWKTYIRCLLLFLKLLSQTAIYWKINIFLMILLKKK